MRVPSGDQAPIVDHRGIVGQRPRCWMFLRWIDQQKLLALVATAIDAVDQPVIRRASPQQRQLLVVVGQLPRGACLKVQRPGLRQAGTTQMEQCPAIAGKHRGSRGADARIHLGFYLHVAFLPRQSTSITTPGHPRPLGRETGHGRLSRMRWR